MKTIIISLLFTFSIHTNVASNHLDGIVNIFDSEDGKTAKTAFKVYSIKEEYEMLKLLKLKPKMHVLTLIEGQYYDVFFVGETKIYFQIISKRNFPYV